MGWDWELKVRAPMVVKVGKVCVDPQVRHGEACFAGTEITLWEVSYLRFYRGFSQEEILDMYPELTEEAFSVLNLYSAWPGKSTELCKSAIETVDEYGWWPGQRPMPLRLD